MIRTLCILLLLLPLSVLAQNRIDKSKKDVKEELEKYVAENRSYKPSLGETDSSITLTLNDPLARQVSFRYAFDITGKCNAETILASCDSCIKRMLRSVLDQKSFQWKKINENQYVSKFEDHLLVELPVENNEFAFTIYKAQWTKEIYDLLIKN